MTTPSSTVGVRSTLIPDVTEGSAVAINDKGQVVGNTFGTPQINHGFLYSGGKTTILDDPSSFVPALGGFLGTQTAGIDDSGKIVGNYDGPGIQAANGITYLSQNGFLLSGGNYTTIDDPLGVDAHGAKDTQLTGINATGQIVGEVLDGEETGRRLRLQRRQIHHRRSDGQH